VVVSAMRRSYSEQLYDRAKSSVFSLLRKTCSDGDAGNTVWFHMAGDGCHL